jgi:hypothetical protein
MKPAYSIIIVLWTMLWTANAYSKELVPIEETVITLAKKLQSLSCDKTDSSFMGKEFPIKIGMVTMESFSLDSKGIVHISNQEKTLIGLNDWTSVLRTHKFPINKVSISYRLENNKEQDPQFQHCNYWFARCETENACVKTFLTTSGKPQIPFYGSSTFILSLGGNKADQQEVKSLFDRLIVLSKEKFKKADK